VEMLYLVIGTILQDRILMAENLTELLILICGQIGRGSILLDIADIQPPRWRLNLYFHHKTLNRACTSKGRAFFDHWIINTYYLEGSHKSKFFKTNIFEKSQWYGAVRLETTKLVQLL
jgi:hypothetical protein